MSRDCAQQLDISNLLRLEQLSSVRATSGNFFPLLAIFEQLFTRVKLYSMNRLHVIDNFTFCDISHKII